MRKLNLYIGFALTLSLFIIISCSGDFLNKEPKSFLSEDNLYQGAGDFKATITGVYSALLPYYNGEGLFYHNNARSDNTLLASAQVYEPSSRFENDDIVSKGNNISNWNAMFEIVGRANYALRDLKSVGSEFLDQSVLDRYRAEALVLRSLAYFEGIRFWGKIPLVTTVQTPDESLENTRTSLDAIWQQLEGDLETAITLLPPKNELSPSENGRLTQEAAKIILAHVLFYQDKKSEAVPYLKDIVSSGAYTLDNNGDGNLSPDDFVDLWKPGTSYSPESIFEISYCPDPAEAEFPAQQCNRAIIPARINDFRFTKETYDSFESGDARRDISLVIGSERDYVETGDENYYFQTKYEPNDVECFGNECSRNLILYRYADVLLLLTEATGNPQYANSVRKRAGLAPKASFTLDEIVRERRAEFIYENDRFNTLVRTGKAVDVLNAKANILDLSPSFKPEFLLWPVPQQALDRNTKLTQNPGYN